MSEQQLKKWEPENETTIGKISIVGPQAYVFWTGRLALIKAFQKEVVAWYHGTDKEPGPTKRAWDSWQQLLSREKEHLKPANDEEKVIKAAVLEYDEELERMRREAQRIADEQAALAAQDKLLEDAIALEEAVKFDDDLIDDAAAAMAALDKPVEVMPVFVPSARPSGTGTTVTHKWKARRDAYDVKALARGVLSGKYQAAWLVPNWDKLDAYAKSTDGQGKVDGIQFFDDRGVSQRAAKR